MSANPTANNISPSAINSTTLPTSVAEVPVSCGVAPDVSELTPDVIPGNSATATNTPTNTDMMPPTKTFPSWDASAMIFDCKMPRFYLSQVLFFREIR